MPGSSIVSANSDHSIGSNNCNTKSSSGTSMAAPGVAGAAALVREYFVDSFYPSGSANAGDALVPSAALIKATLVSAGQNMTGVSGWPANGKGWGRVALDDSLELSGDSRDLFVDDNAGFAQGSSNDTVTYDLVVSSSEPLKVTLVWTDYPSTPAASTHLVNDLDLKVSGPGGTFKGNVFSGGVSTTGGTPFRWGNSSPVARCISCSSTTMMPAPATTRPSPTSVSSKRAGAGAEAVAPAPWTTTSSPVPRIGATARAARALRVPTPSAIRPNKRARW